MENINKKNELNGIVNYLPQDAKNGITIAPPDGFEVDKIEVVNGYLHATFKEKERKLPKSWEEFEKLNPLKVEYVTYNNGYISYEKQVVKRYLTNLLSDTATAEAVLALCQLIQLRNCYNGDWVPDFEDADMKKYSIEFYKGKITVSSYYSSSCSPLYFKSEELCEKFLLNFRPLIEKLKPLYGIKEGGEE